MLNVYSYFISWKIPTGMTISDGTCIWYKRIFFYTPVFNFNRIFSRLCRCVMKRGYRQKDNTNRLINNARLESYIFKLRCYFKFLLCHLLPASVCVRSCITLIRTWTLHNWLWYRIDSFLDRLFLVRPGVTSGQPCTWILWSGVKLSASPISAYYYSCLYIIIL